VAVETNESVNLNNGRVWLTSTDQSGKFKVGDTFAVDQQTGFVTIDPQSVSINVVSDLTPELGGDLDVLTRTIYSSLTPDVTFGDTIRETVSSVPWPVVSQPDIGTDPNQVPLNGYLGTMAFQDSAGVNVDLATISSAAITAFSNVPLLTGGGLKFPATQVASADPNTLDDYEEGTWTPTIVGSSTAGTATYSVQSGTYTKIGRQVTVTYEVSYSSGTGTGNLRVASVPFAVSGAYFYSTVDLVNIVMSATSFPTAIIGGSKTVIEMYQTAMGGGTLTTIAYDAAGSIYGSITYTV
jgi:hypothetical protein